MEQASRVPSIPSLLPEYEDDEMSRRRILIWALPTLVYVVFVGWYTDFGGALRDDDKFGRATGKE